MLINYGALAKYHSSADMFHSFSTIFALIAFIWSVKSAHMFTVTSLGHARRIEIIESPWSWASYFFVEILHSMKILLYTAVYQIYRLYKLFLRCIQNLCISKLGATVDK